MSHDPHPGTATPMTAPSALLRFRFTGALCAASLTLLAACGGEEREPGAAPPRQPAGMIERAMTPSPTPVPDSLLDAAEALIRRRVENEAFPGAALAVGNRGLIQREVAFGRTHWDDEAPQADPRTTRYDLASLTKVVATTAAVMALVEEGRMELDAPVRQYLPAFSGGDKDDVTIRQLLTHTGGLRAGAADINPDASRSRVRDYLVRMPLAMPPGQDVLYSDAGFVVLWEAARAAAGEPLQRYLSRRVWEPLGMTSTAMGVRNPCKDCAPTLHLEEKKEPYTGGSYDEVARRMDGITGNAGAFSTAHDLARFAAMMANEGRLGDVRVFERATVRDFTAPQEGTGTRALGWEVYCGRGKVKDSETCDDVLAFGHTGVTGTSIWIDPESRTWVVLLANRVYLPRLETDMQKLRRNLFKTVVPDE